MGEKQEISSIIIQHDWLLEALNEEEYAVFEKCKGISRTILLRYRVNWRGREDRQGLGKQRPIRDPSVVYLCTEPKVTGLKMSLGS